MRRTGTAPTARPTADDTSGRRSHPRPFYGPAYPAPFPRGPGYRNPPLRPNSGWRRTARKCSSRYGMSWEDVSGRKDLAPRDNRPWESRRARGSTDSERGPRGAARFAAATFPHQSAHGDPASARRSNNSKPTPSERADARVG